MEASVFIEPIMQVTARSRRNSDDIYSALQSFSKYLSFTIPSYQLKDDIITVVREVLGDEEVIDDKEFEKFQLIIDYGISSLNDFLYVIKSKKRISIDLGISDQDKKLIEIFLLIMTYFNCIKPKNERLSLYDGTRYQKLPFDNKTLVILLTIKLIDSNLIDFSQCEKIFKTSITLFEYAFTHNLNSKFIDYKESFLKSMNLMNKCVETKKDEKDEKVIIKVNRFVQNILNYYNVKIFQNPFLFFSLNRTSTFLGLLNLGKFQIISKNTNQLIIEFLKQMYSFQLSQTHLATFFTSTKIAFINKPVANISYTSQILNYLKLLNSLAKETHYFNGSLIKEGFIFCDEYKNQNKIIIKNLNFGKDFTFIFAFNCRKTRKNQINTLFSFIDNKTNRAIYTVYLNQINQMCFSIQTNDTLKEQIKIESFIFEDSKDYIIYFQLEKSKKITLYVDGQKIYEHKEAEVNLEKTLLYLGATMKKGETCDHFNGVFGNLLIFNEKIKDNTKNIITQLKYSYYLISEVNNKSFKYTTFNSSKEYINTVSSIVKSLEKGELSLASLQFSLWPNFFNDLKKGKNVYKLKNTKTKLLNGSSYPTVTFHSCPIPENTLTFPFKQFNFYDEFLYYEGFSYLVMVLEFYYNIVYQNKSIDNLQEMFDGIEQICDLLIKIIQNCQIYNNWAHNFERIFFSLSKFAFLVRNIFIIFILVIIGKDSVKKL